MMSQLATPIRISLFAFFLANGCGSRPPGSVPPREPAEELPDLAVGGEPELPDLQVPIDLSLPHDMARLIDMTPPPPPPPKYPTCTFAPTTPALCTGTSCPVTLDTTVSCTGSSYPFYGVTATAGVGGVDYVLAGAEDRVSTFDERLRAQLHTIDGTNSGQSENPPLVARDEDDRPRPAVVLSDGAGRPYALQQDSASAVSFYYKNSGTWRSELVPMITNLTSAVMAADGTLYVSGSIPNMPNVVLSRDPTGKWSSKPFTNYVDMLALDGANRLYKATCSSGSSINYIIGDSATETAVPDSYDLCYSLEMAIPGTGATASAPILSMMNNAPVDESPPAGLNVFLPDSAQVLHHSRVGGTTTTYKPAAPSCDQCKTTSAHEEGDAIYAHGMTRASDGTVWLAYITHHVDLDATLKRYDILFWCGCSYNQITYHADQGVTKLNLARFVPGATPRFDVRYQISIPLDHAIGRMYLSSRPNELHLTFQPSGAAVRRLVFDTRRL